MPVFAYKGFGQKGKAIAGVRDADSAKGLRLLLRKEGIVVHEIEEANESATQKKRAIRLRLPGSGSVPSQDLAVMTRQLATLVNASIPLVDALSALVEQVDHPRLRGVMGQIKQRVNEGISLADAMADHPKVFTQLFTNMIRAGESSGALDVVLGRLADFTENQAKLRQKLIGAMFYPVIMLSMACIVVSILMIFVVPKIAKLFEDQKAALPLPTAILIFLSYLLSDYWWVIVLFLVGGIYAFRRYVQTEEGRRRFDKQLLHVPLFGSIIRMLAVTRFARTLSTLLASGVQLLVALDIVKNIVDNVILSKAIEDARGAIQEGESIAAPLKRSGEFPPIVTHMVAIGEKSGQLEPMLMKIADAYEIQAESRIMAITSIIEPVLIVVMGLVVAFIVFAIMLPMLQISDFAG